MSMDSMIEVKANPKIPEVNPGDEVKVSVKVVEGEKARTQVFKGVVIKVRHGEAGTNFTVRRITYGIGVERTFSVRSPMVEKVEIMRHGKVRRAKLYYLRGLSGRKARIKEKRVIEKEMVVGGEEALAQEAVVAEEIAQKAAATEAVAEKATAEKTTEAVAEKAAEKTTTRKPAEVVAEKKTVEKAAEKQENQPQA